MYDINDALHCVDISSESSHLNSRKCFETTLVVCVLLFYRCILLQRASAYREMISTVDCLDSVHDTVTMMKYIPGLQDTKLQALYPIVDMQQKV